MKSVLLTFCVFSCALLSVRADPAAEKAFVDKYKTAFEGKDTKTLESLLYTEGAHPMALEFYKMMLSEGAGSKISKIELVDLTPEDLKQADEVMPGPDGSKTKMSLKPVKKLVIEVEQKSESSGGTASNTTFVAEKNGKLVIPVPAAVK